MRIIVQSLVLVSSLSLLIKIFVIDKKEEKLWYKRKEKEELEYLTKYSNIISEEDLNIWMENHWTSGSPKGKMTNLILFFFLFVMLILLIFV